MASDRSDFPPTQYSVPENDANASQFYIAEVIDVHETHGADEGDIELILTDNPYAVGETYIGSSYGAPKKAYEICGGPYKCPPMPHVLALEAWFEEFQPETAWDAYRENVPVETD